MTRKTKIKKLLIFILAILLFSSKNFVFAHPGRTDSSGCHTCRTNCPSWGLDYGEYHCHRAKSDTPQPEEPIRSHKGEDGEPGYTAPAPDYKTPINNVENNSEEKNDDNSATYLWLALGGGAGYWIYKRKKS